LEFARHNGKVEIETVYEDLTNLEIMQLSEKSGTFDFWKEDGENIYSEEDGEAV